MLSSVTEQTYCTFIHSLMIQSEEKHNFCQVFCQASWSKKVYIACAILLKKSTDFYSPLLRLVLFFNMGVGVVLIKVMDSLDNM